MADLRSEKNISPLVPPQSHPWLDTL